MNPSSAMALASAGVRSAARAGAEEKLTPTAQSTALRRPALIFRQRNICRLLPGSVEPNYVCCITLTIGLWSNVNDFIALRNASGLVRTPAATQAPAWDFAFTRMRSSLQVFPGVTLG